jgi:APA family basic amino acid/polyamine antiporter
VFDVPEALSYNRGPMENGKKDGSGFRREMGLLDSAFLVMGGVIGTGIFMTTGFIIGFVPSPWLVMLAWVLGGLITLTGALSFEELAAMYPSAGGSLSI